jgi:ferredoxin-type protein NapH
MQVLLPGRLSGYGFTFWRRLLLSISFVLLICIPLTHRIFGITVVQGWYQSLGIGKLRIVSPLEGLQSILTTHHVHVPALIGMLIPVLVAFFLGRVFCSWVCPISFLAEGRSFFSRHPPGRKQDRIVLPRQMLWYTLIADMLFALVLGAPVFVFLSPPGLVGRELMLAILFQTLTLEGLVVVLVMALELLSRRFYCRSLCPLGALLALLGSRRRLRMVWHVDSCVACGRCDAICPLGLAPSKAEADSPYCWNCGLCSDHCPHDALRFSWRSPS